jgi:hypothetical protein
MAQQDLDFGTGAANDGEVIGTAMAKVQANFDELYALADFYATGIPATHPAVGISTSNTGAQNKTALLNFITAFAVLAAIRDEYVTGPTLIFPIADDTYVFDGEIDIRCTMELRGGGVHQRFTGSPIIEFTDGFEYGWRFPYVDVGDPAPGGWWCRVKDLQFQPVTNGGVDYGIINNCTMYFENVSCLNFKYGGFLSAGQSSGTHDVPAPYETGGSTTMLGSVNITRFLWCSGRGSTEGDGFIASGNIAAIILYDQCNAQLNNGCGFRDNTSIGCYYAFCHTAQNSVKTTHHGGVTGATTNNAGYAGGTVSPVVNGATVITLASAGTGAIVAGDLVSFGANTTRYLVAVGDADVSNGGTITISTRISTAGSGSILAGTGLVDTIPASNTAITVYKFYASVKDSVPTTGATTNNAGYASGVGTVNLASAGTGVIEIGDRVVFAGDATEYTITEGDADVSGGGNISFTPVLAATIPASNTAITVLKYSTEPGVGADWKNWFAPVIGQLADNAWAVATSFRATGGINCVFQPTSGPCHVNIGQYTEGGQEVGYVPYGAGWADGGNLWQATGPDGRANIRPDSAGFRQPNAPPTWKSADASGNSWGASLGASFLTSGAYTSGDTRDPDVNASTPDRGGIGQSFSTARFVWEWVKGTSLRTLGITATGFTRSGYTGRGHVLAERGILIGGMNGASDTPNTTLARIMTYTNRAAIPTGTVLVTGDFLFYPGAGAGTAAIELVTTGATTSASGGVGATIATIASRP